MFRPVGLIKSKMWPDTMTYLGRNLTYPPALELLLFRSWWKMFACDVADTCIKKSALLMGGQATRIAPMQTRGCRTPIGMCGIYAVFSQYFVGQFPLILPVLFVAEWENKEGWVNCDFVFSEKISNFTFYITLSKLACQDFYEENEIKKLIAWSQRF